MKLGDMVLPANRAKILLYGQAGTGKTAFTLTGGSALQLIDLDDGVRTGKTFRDKWQATRLQADVLTCTEPNPEVPVAFDKVKSFITSIGQECRNHTYPFSILVIDSFTALSEAATRKVMSNQGGSAKLPQIQHWGIAFHDIEELFIQIRSLPIVVICTMHEMTEELLEGTVRLCPMVQGNKLPAKMRAYFDEIWRSKVQMIDKNANYTIETTSTSISIARSRFNFPMAFAQDIGLLEALKRGGVEIPSPAVPSPAVPNVGAAKPQSGGTIVPLK